VTPTRPERCSESSRGTVADAPCRPRSKSSGAASGPGSTRSPTSTWPASLTDRPKLNNLIKRIKRIGFGFRNFENYRIRALLYAGKPNWRVLGSIVVRW
jgi:hypothetical protein